MHALGYKGISGDRHTDFEWGVTRHGSPLVQLNNLYAVREENLKEEAEDEIPVLDLISAECLDADARKVPNHYQIPRKSISWL